MTEMAAMTSATVHYRTCPLCEATCGIAVEVAGDRVLAVRGDPEDPFSKGYICPKAVALRDVHHDPDRLRQPLRRKGEGWEPIGWEEAVAEVSERIAAIQRAHGNDSVALYYGNPTTHSYAATLAGLEVAESLGTRNLFSTAGLDHLPHMFASYHMFGHKALLPVPDLDRTDFLLVLGANPAVSNGSLMTAPDMVRRLKELRARGGRLVVVDPRRTRTAELADTHLAIRPGTDVLLLLALVHTLFAEDRLRLGRLAELTDGLDQVREAVRDVSPEKVEPLVGLAAGTIRRLAADFAAADSAVCYGRLGVCAQPFGALCCWLIQVINVLTGNLDRVGGSMLTTPAVDLVGLAALLKQTGSFDRYRSRVRGLPEFGGELPPSILAEEIEEPGRGQIRALVTIAGNPVLSSPDGARLDRALASLELVVAVDFYLNETTRHAHIILPPPFALERDHYDLLMNALAVRNVTRYCPPLFAPAPGAWSEERILLELARRIGRRKGGVSGWAAAARCALLQKLTLRRFVGLCLRFGPHGAGLNPFKKGLTLGRLEQQPRTLDLGPLEPGRLPARLYTPGRKIVLAPQPMLDDLERVRRRFFANGTAEDALLLIGRRQLNDNNSWMHNSPTLAKGRERCTLLMHPDDAVRHGVEHAGRVRLRSRVGSVVVPLEVTDGVAPGVVSLPHGYGHHRQGSRLRVASARPGVSLNDLTDPGLFDELSGTAVLNGTPVAVEAVEA